MAAGYGFRPVQRGGAGYQTAGFIELPIDGDLLGTPIFNGDSVQYNVNTYCCNCWYCSQLHPSRQC